MFSIFRKKGPFPTDSKWQILEGKIEDRPLIVRKNESAKALHSDSTYSWRLGFAIQLKFPNESGLPGPDEAVALSKIEDELVEGFERDQDGLLVLVVTTSGMREFVFYAKDPKRASSKIAGLKERIRPRELQHYIAEDSSWSGYDQF